MHNVPLTRHMERGRLLLFVSPISVIKFFLSHFLSIHSGLCPYYFNVLIYSATPQLAPKYALPYLLFLVYIYLVLEFVFVTSAIYTMKGISNVLNFDKNPSHAVYLTTIGWREIFILFYLRQKLQKIQTLLLHTWLICWCTEWRGSGGCSHTAAKNINQTYLSYK